MHHGCPCCYAAHEQCRGWILLTAHAKAVLCVCRYSGATPTSIRVMYISTTGAPSGIAPFNTVYGQHPGPDKTAERGLLVAQPTTGGYVVLEVNDRQVECLLKCGTECEGHC